MNVPLMFQTLVLLLLSTTIFKLAYAKRRKNEDDGQSNPVDDITGAWEMEECQGAFWQYRAELNRALYFKVPRDKDCVVQKIKREGCQLYAEKLEKAVVKSGVPLDIHAKCPHRAYETDNLNLYCGDGEVVNVISATFGNKTGGCSGDPDRDLAHVQQHCNGFPGCSVHASVGVFGDPCLDTPKYLEVDYKCEAAQPPSRELRFSLRYDTCATLVERIGTRWIRGSPNLLEKKFAAIKSTSLSGEDLFFGRKRTWGDGEACGEIHPSTRTLHTSKVDKKGTREFEILVFRNGTRVATSGGLYIALEGEEMRMTCDEGKLIDVTTAFWGNRPRLCRGKNSELIVLQTLCNHKSSCNFEAKTDWFGNPCSDIVKYLEFKFDCLKEESVSKEPPWKWVDFTPEFQTSGPPITAVRVGVEGSFDVFVGRASDNGKIRIGKILIANDTDIRPFFCLDKRRHWTDVFQILTDPGGRLHWVKASANSKSSAKFSPVTAKSTVDGKDFVIGRHVHGETFVVGLSPSNSDFLMYYLGNEVFSSQKVLGIALDGEKMRITCDEGKFIDVTMAIWGNGEKSCPGKKSDLFILQTLCNHKSSCDFEAKSDWFGLYYCWHIARYLEFKYECLKEESVSKETPWKWVDFTPEFQKSSPPNTAIKVGVEGGFNVFMGRAIYNGTIVIGKILIANVTHVRADFPIDEKEQQRNLFQILTDPEGRLQWAKASANSKSRAKFSAVTTKNTVDGKDFVIGRHVHGETFVVGLSVFDSDFLVYYSGNEGPKKTKDFDILIPLERPVVVKPGELTRVHDNELVKLVCACEDGAVINVLRAFYDNPETKECHTKHPEMDLHIAQMCNGKKTCDVYPSFDFSASPCEQKKNLELKYECSTGKVHRIKETENYSDPPQTLACENGTISIISGLYGNREKNCSGNDEKWDLILLQHMCDGMETCSVQASNYVFGDPCYGIEKFLEYKYTCLSGINQRDPWKWVDCTRDRCSFGSTAVKAGTEGDKNVCVARGFKDRQILIGPIIETSGIAIFSMGQETKMNTFQVLHDPHNKLEWVKSSSSGLKPYTIKRAVVGGITKEGENILIGRTHITQTAEKCGKVDARSSTLTRAWSKDIKMKEFDVLVLKEPSTENK